ncbi:hypothetical protein pb186bvf_001979 [Paramecium bursaria]
MQNNYDFLFKILLIGDLKVGKSSILLRFTDNTFNEQFLPNIGVDFKIKTIDCQGKQVKLQIWDTAGQERFKTITSSFYKGALGILIVFDISNRDSFNNLLQWMDEIKKHASEGAVLVLVGNKLDIQDNREVSTVEAQALAQKLNIAYIETSSLNSINIEQPFVRIVEELLQKIEIK